MAYTRRVKEAAISMMLPPNSQSLSQISERTQIPVNAGRFLTMSAERFLTI